MMQVLGMWTGEKWRFDTLAVISFGLSLLAWGLHIYISIKLAQTIVAERAMIGRKASMGGLIAGLLLGGWASMFALFFCGCLAVMMTLG